MKTSEQMHANFRLLLAFMAACECLIVIGGWSIYKWQGAVPMILVGTAGVLCSFASIKQLIDEEERAKFNPTSNEV